MDERKSEFTVKMGKRIEFRRKQLDLTQDELAHKLGYKHKTSISKIEKGINEVSQSMIPEIAKAAYADRLKSQNRLAAFFKNAYENAYEIEKAP